MTSRTRLALANASDALARIDPPPPAGEGRVGDVVHPAQPSTQPGEGEAAQAA
jgi:hypothetical protein